MIRPAAGRTGNVGVGGVRRGGCFGRHRSSPVRGCRLERGLRSDLLCAFDSGVLERAPQDVEDLLRGQWVPLFPGLHQLQQGAPDQVTPSAGRHWPNCPLLLPFSQESLEECGALATLRVDVRFRALGMAPADEGIEEEVRVGVRELKRRVPDRAQHFAEGVDLRLDGGSHLKGVDELGIGLADHPPRHLELRTEVAEKPSDGVVHRFSQYDGWSPRQPDARQHLCRARQCLPPSLLSHPHPAPLPTRPRGRTDRSTARIGAAQAHPDRRV